ncbi:MAG: ATPase [Chlorobi bacterium]|nr:ATPase [Chlorobiota bacterium]
MQEYKEYFILPAGQEEIYNALTNKVMIEIWTGESAEMSEEPGSDFSLWDGSITGKNLEFEKDRKIVQQWYFEGQEKPSVVTIKLHPHKKGTSVELKHTNIPDSAYENITEGWEHEYFAALSQLFEE